MRPIVTVLLFAMMTFMRLEVFAMDWTKLRLTIDDIEFKRGGEIRVYVFLKGGFPKKHEKALKHYRFDVAQLSHQMIIEVPDVPFAIKVHHDEDRSGKINKNWTGIYPAEGLGFSSGAKIGFGPPSFKKAKMNIPADKKIRLAVIYP